MFYDRDSESQSRSRHPERTQAPAPTSGAQALISPEFAAELRAIPLRSRKAYEALRDAITSGRAGPGQWLREAALAQELGVSRRTVTEALRQLVAQGLAVHEPNRGVRVATIPLEEFEEIYGIRRRLEGWALEMAAQRISEADLARMRELLPSVAGITGGTRALERAAHDEFHWIGIRACGKRHLIAMLERVWDLTDPFSYGRPYLGDEEQRHYQEELEEHARVLRALEQRDSAGAAQATAAHIDSMVQFWRRMSELRASREASDVRWAAWGRRGDEARPAAHWGGTDLILGPAAPGTRSGPSDSHPDRRSPQGGGMPMS